MKFAIAKTNDGKFCFYIRTRDLLARRFFKIYVFDLVDDKMKIVKIVDEAR
jgi:transcription antitermination factor NusA-like protein